MKIFKTTQRAVDKHNLRHLLSDIPTRYNGNFVITDIKTPMGTISDWRSLGGETIINIGKSKLEIDPLNGNVIKYKKPFFKNLKKLVNQASELIRYTIENSKNPEKVKKSTLELLTFSHIQTEKLGQL